MSRSQKLSIPIVWVSHLKTEKEKEEFKQSIVSSVALRRMKEILEQRLEVIESSETDYDCPSWAYKQAHFNGRREELKDLLRLLAFIK